MDPFAGVHTDPSSLHRYLYATADPLNNFDPSGRISLPSLSMAITLSITTAAGAVLGYRQGGIRGGAEGAAAGFFVGLLIYEVATLVVGIGLVAGPTLTVWSQRGGFRTFVLPRNAPVTVTIPQGPVNTVTLSPPVSTSLRLTEAATRPGGLVQRVQQTRPTAVRLEAERALGAWRRAVVREMDMRGSTGNGPGGVPPVSLEEATANTAAFFARIDAQFTPRQRMLMEALLDGQL